jgi:probable F420-dependent oxidoreductase
MELGLWCMNVGTCADPEVAVRVAQAAEAAGFESLWTGEHAVLPHPRPDGYPAPSDLPWLDSIASLTLLATATQRVRIASGTMELPLHHPVRLAKALASVDVISGGRLIAGLGLGNLEVEFAAFGVDMAERGLRMDEGLDALLELWTGDLPRYEGRTVSFSGIDAQPRPVQPGGPPIVLGGGGTPRARRRIIQRAHGWYLNAADLDATAAAMDRIAEEQQQLERPTALGPLEVTVTPPDVIDRPTFRRFEELGVHRLVFLPRPGAPPEDRYAPVAEEQILDTIERAAALR